MNHKSRISSSPEKPVKRSGELDFWKLVFAFIIVILHSEYLPAEPNLRYFKGGSIFVEFFFITSGYLMAHSADKKLNYQNLTKETTTFLKKKIVTFYPYLIFGFFVALVAKALFDQQGWLEVVKTVYTGIPELLLLKSTGTVKVLINSPMWYLSAMVLSMAVAYPLILKYQDFFKKIAAPLVAFTLLGYLYQKYGHFRGPENWDGLFLKGTVRGFAEILLGVFCHEIGKGVSKVRFTALSRLLFTVLEYGSLILIIIYSNTKTYWDMDVPTVLLFCVSIIIICNNLSLLSGFWNKLRITPYLGKFSLMLYINHIYWVWIFEMINVEMSYRRMLLLYIGCSMISAALCWILVDFLRGQWGKHKQKLAALFMKDSCK